MTKQTKDNQKRIRARDGRNTLARVLAPEDIRPGLDVTVLETVLQIFPFCAEFETTPRRMAWMPYGPHEPLKVLDICLPYVLVRSVRGRSRVLDVRQCRLARLDGRFARRARAALREKAGRKGRRK